MPLISQKNLKIQITKFQSVKWQLSVKLSPLGQAHYKEIEEPIAEGLGEHTYTDYEYKLAIITLVLIPW